MDNVSERLFGTNPLGTLGHVLVNKRDDSSIKEKCFLQAQSKIASDYYYYHKLYRLFTTSHRKPLSLRMVRHGVIATWDKNGFLFDCMFHLGGI